MIHKILNITLTDNEINSEEDVEIKLIINVRTKN